MMPKLPDGTAEFVLMAILACWFGFLWWQKTFGSNKRDNEKDIPFKDNKPTVSECALAEEKLKTIVVKFEALIKSKEELERQLIEIHKQSHSLQERFLDHLEDNTEQMTTLNNLFSRIVK